VPKVDLVSKKWCDLVFEHKNKAYGAYQLRSEVGKRNWRALCGIGLFCLISLGTYIAGHTYLDLIWQHDLNLAMEAIQKDRLLKHDDVLLHFVDLTPQPQVMAQEHKPQITVPEIVETVEPQTQHAVPEPSTEELETEPLEETSTPEHEPTQSPNTSDAPLPTTTQNAEDVVFSMPEFPGGIHQLIKWLDTNIICPPLLMKHGIEGTTHLTFYVDTAGVVSHFDIEEELHPMISSAILKAAERMPKWEPAKGKVNFSKVKITIPVTYHKR
jgi:protein TonB